MLSCIRHGRIMKNKLSQFNLNDSFHNYNLWGSFILGIYEVGSPHIVIRK